VHGCLGVGVERVLPAGGGVHHPAQSPAQPVLTLQGRETQRKVRSAAGLTTILHIVPGFPLIIQKTPLITNSAGP